MAIEEEWNGIGMKAVSNAFFFFLFFFVFDFCHELEVKRPFTLCFCVKILHEGELSLQFQWERLDSYIRI